MQVSDLVYDRRKGLLTWGATHFRAISGPHGKGALPVGTYRIKTRYAVVGKALSNRYEDSVTLNRWFLPIEPQFLTPRDSFGIHPDGNIPGTLGCIGLASVDAGSFWSRWMATPLPSRPDQLHVIE